MTYQDQWAYGLLIKPGYRSCAPRYEIVKEQCKKFQGAFTVCDIGANMCYFGIRLTEDFKGCSVDAYEFDHFEMRKKHLESSGSKRVTLAKRRLAVDDLHGMAKHKKYGLVLALSVLHHADGATEPWIDGLRTLGKWAIVEMAGSDSERADKKHGYSIPDGEIIGYGDSHLQEGYQRPIMLIKGY